MDDEVYAKITEGVRKPTKNKLALFFCGASGTGKTTGRHKFLRDVKLKTSFVYLNIDDIKGIEGREAMRVMFNKLLKRSIDDGYSIFYDGTCRNKSDIIPLIKDLKSKNYRVMFGMVYATLPTALKRVEERRGQFVSESAVKDIYQHMSKNAEEYMKVKEIDEIYLYNNEQTITLIFQRSRKEVKCISPSTQFYFDVSEYCD